MKNKDWNLYKSRKDKVLCRYMVRVVHARDNLFVENCNVYAKEGVPLNIDGTPLDDNWNSVYYFFFAKRFDAELFRNNPILLYKKYSSNNKVEQLMLSL